MPVTADDDAVTVVVTVEVSVATLADSAVGVSDAVGAGSVTVAGACSSDEQPATATQHTNASNHHLSNFMTFPSLAPLTVG